MVVLVAVRCAVRTTDGSIGSGKVRSAHPTDGSIGSGKVRSAHPTEALKVPLQKLSE